MEQTFEHLKIQQGNHNGTSFHNHIIMATVENLRQVLGEPTYIQNTGEDKVNYEWERETSTGEPFTVYDWKEYRPISETEIIEWHIGTLEPSHAAQALEELQNASLYLHSLTTQK